MTREALGGSGVVATRYVVPRVHGDAGAAYRLAVLYQDLADVVRSAHQRVAAVIGALSAAWHGEGHEALHEPVQAFLHNSASLVRALDQAAGIFHTYGQQLQKAHEHHSFSMHKLLKVGAVAAVSATAIVVTVGAAGVVEAAAAGAAVGGATEAAGGAVAADVVAASALDAAVELLPALRPLLSFVLPQLLQVEWAVAGTALWDEATTGRLPWRDLAESGGFAFGAASIAAKGVTLVGDSRWLPHVVEGSAWAGAAAADDAFVAHRFDVEGIAETFVMAGGGPVGRDALRARGWWPAQPDYRRLALVSLLHRSGRITDAEIAHELALLRQPVGELTRGDVDLRLHEGPGNTIRGHVGKGARELLGQLRTTTRPLASTYWDEPAARDAIQQTLTGHRSVIRQWLAAGSPTPLRLHLVADHDLGFAVDRRNTVRLLRHAVVVLARDPAGVVIVTSYPVL